MGQTFEKSFKQEAFRLVQTSGKSRRQVAENLGVAMSILGRWCTEMATKGERAFVEIEHKQTMHLISTLDEEGVEALGAPSRCKGRPFT